MQAIKLDNLMNYDQYTEWQKTRPDHERYELIDGVPYMMAATRHRHNRAAGNLLGLFYEALKGKPCNPASGGLEFRTDYRFGDTSAIVPDLYVLCKKKESKISLDDNNYTGAPDIAIEVLSPSTAHIDKTIKKFKYQHAGVREYWIVDPVHYVVDVYALVGESYEFTTYTMDDSIALTITKDEVTINVSEIFEGIVD